MIKSLSRNQSPVAALAVVGIVFLILGTAIALTKSPWTDELFYSVPGFDLIHRGTFGVPMLAPSGCVALPPGSLYPGVRDHVYFPGVLHFLLSSVWYRIVGFSIFSIRFYSLLWGFVYLAACYTTLKKVTSRTAAALAGTACVAVCHIFVNGAADGRPDVICGTLGMSAIAAYLSLRERRLALAILASHALLGLSAFVHPLAFLYFVSVLCLTLACDFRRLRVPHVLLALLPYLAVFGVWGALMFDNRSVAEAQIRMLLAHRAPVRQPFIVETISRYWGFYVPPNTVGLARLKAFPLLFYIFGVLGTMLGARKIGSYRIVLLLAFPIVVGLPFMDGYRPSYYLLHTVPWFCMALGLSLVALWDQGRRIQKTVALVVTALFLLTNVSWTLYSASRNPLKHEFADAARIARQRAGASALVTGPAEMVLAFGIYNNLEDDASLGYYSGRKPDVIIVDERGYGQAFQIAKSTAPALDRHISSLLENEFVIIHRNRLYRVYARR